MEFILFVMYYFMRVPLLLALCLVLQLALSAYHSDLAYLLNYQQNYLFSRVHLRLRSITTGHCIVQDVTTLCFQLVQLREFHV